jgi:hypothetical protein
MEILYSRNIVLNIMKLPKWLFICTRNRSSETPARASNVELPVLPPIRSGISLYSSWADDQVLPVRPEAKSVYGMYDYIEEDIKSQKGFSPPLAAFRSTVSEGPVKQRRAAQRVSLCALIPRPLGRGKFIYTM